MTLKITFYLLCTLSFMRATFGQSLHPSKYMVMLDSSGIDTLNNSLIIKIGEQMLYFGNKQLGNDLIAYVFAKKDAVSAEELRHWSVQNTKNGNYRFAIEKLEEAMQIDPKNVSGYYGWVLLYYYRDYRRALEILAIHDDFTPDFADAPMGEDIRYLKSLAWFQLGDYAKALSLLNEYIEDISSTISEEYVDVYAFVQKGRCLTALSHFDEAITAFKKAINIFENCPEAYYFMALTELELNQKEVAITHLEKALAFMDDGFGNEDPYITYFHEIYPQQIIFRLEQLSE